MNINQTPAKEHQISKAAKTDQKTRPF